VRCVIVAATAAAVGCGSGGNKTTVIVDPAGAPEKWFTDGRLPRNARPGADTFVNVGCLNCHSYLGSGEGPELTTEGRQGRGRQWQIDHLRDPESTVPGSTMPSYTKRGTKRLREIAVFLEESRSD
jgi:hypothetical protein